VIPTALGIRRAGASKASTASFMVATPETGVDSIGITYALMGPVMAIARPLAAIASAITAGVLVKTYDNETAPEPEPAKTKSCCHSSNQQTLATRASPANRLKEAMSYGFGKLLADFMDWLLVGLVFAALIKTFVPESLFLQYGSGIWAMLIVIVISIPMYICATASTPIAAGLMLSGFSPGAALVFMLTGPATNIATLMVVKKELGNRSLVAYLFGVAVTAIIMGLGLDWILLKMDYQMVITQGGHDHTSLLFYTTCAVLLACLMLRQYWLRWAASKEASLA
jgi:uncharacterized membrane protein YraQ (UPF0718 family)